MIRIQIAKTNGTKFFNAEKGVIREGKLIQKYLWFTLNIIPRKIGFYFELSYLKSERR